jgi:hypothetical protein
MAAGPASVLVRLGLTQQAVVVTAAFTFESPSGGGGGCTIAPVGGPRGPFDGFTAFLPVLVVLAWFATGARRVAPARSRVLP